MLDNMVQKMSLNLVFKLAKDLAREDVFEPVGGRRQRKIDQEKR